jgi:hypothetical protein
MTYRILTLDGSGWAILQAMALHHIHGDIPDEVPHPPVRTGLPHMGIDVCDATLAGGKTRRPTFPP